MEKVKLPREVAEAIDKLKAEGYRPYPIVCKVHEGKSYDDRVSVLRKYAIDNDNKLMHALVNGYEVEQTPEDRIRQMYREWAEKVTEAYKSGDEESHKKYKCRIQGVMETLVILGIQIEGVNA